MSALLFAFIQGEKLQNKQATFQRVLLPSISQRNKKKKNLKQKQRTPKDLKENLKINLKKVAELEPNQN